jgi:hypothetical protein
LGIALTVLPAQKDDVWKGLTVERLLFEHILRTEKDQFENETAAELCLRLSADAKRVLDQIDLGRAALPTPIFESEARAVAETRFFKPILGPHGGYRLDDEGLNLALGFAVVDQLWRTKTDGGNLDRTVSALLDPIASVDASSPVVTAALYICAFDVERFEPEIFKRLVDAFSNLQNLSDEAYPQFFDTLRRHPEVAFDAIRDGLLERRSQINAKWLSAAAFELFQAEETKSVASSAVVSWLKHVNIDATDQQSSYGRVDQQDLERAKIQQERIDELIASFSEHERALFNDCIITKGDVERLLSLSLKLLAGQPLAPWADSLAYMGFAFSLDHSLHQSRKLVRQLTHFNTVDPLEAAIAFENSVEPLRVDDTSKTGRWSIVRMLFATGEEGLSIEAKAIADELNADRESFTFESQLEGYCASDPCDPASVLPDNVAKTISEYKQIEVTELYSNMAHSQQDWFRKDALCAVSRFGPDTAISKNRELSESIVTRTKMPLRQLALNGTAVVPLMTTDGAISLAERLRTDEHLDELVENDRRVVQMYMLRFCLDHLNGNEQLDLLTNDVVKGDYPLDAIPSLKRPDEPRIIAALDSAFLASDSDAAFGALTIIAHTFDYVSPELEASVERFRGWDDALVRAAVFEIALYLNCDVLRRNHVDSAWNSVTAEGQKTYEAWNGSCLLIEAAKSEEIALSEMIERISPKTLYYAARSLGTPVSNMVLRTVDTRLESASKASGILTEPPIETTVSEHDLVDFNFLSAEERDKQQLNGIEALRAQSSETNEDFDKRQARLRQQHDDLELELAEQDAKFLLDYIDVDVLGELLKERPDFARQWSNLLLGLSNQQFYWFKDFAFAVARAIVEASEETALQLFERASTTDSFVRHVFKDGLSLEQKAIWSCPQTDRLTSIWRKRLRECDDDAQLAAEILAAERFGATDFILNEVKTLMSSGRAIDRSCALTIAGFSHQFNDMRELIVEFSDSPSFCGDSALSALRAHDRAVWSKHWVRMMWEADNAEAFWLNLNLAGKIIDGRESYTREIFDAQNPWRHFATIFTAARKKRMEVWGKERAKKLFGMEKPEDCFLPYRHIT